MILPVVMAGQKKGSPLALWPTVSPSNGILLVKESDSHIGDAGQVSLVIQRCRGATVDAAGHGNSKFMEPEGSTAAVEVVVMDKFSFRERCGRSGGVGGFRFVCGALGVFSGLEEPEESEDGKVDDKFIDVSEFWVFGVKSFS